MERAEHLCIFKKMFSTKVCRLSQIHIYFSVVDSLKYFQVLVVSVSVLVMLSWRVPGIQQVEV